MDISLNSPAGNANEAAVQKQRVNDTLRYMYICIVYMYLKKWLALEKPNNNKTHISNITKRYGNAYANVTYVVCMLLTSYNFYVTNIKR